MQTTTKLMGDYRQLMDSITVGAKQQFLFLAVWEEQQEARDDGDPVWGFSDRTIVLGAPFHHMYSELKERACSVQLTI